MVLDEALCKCRLLLFEDPAARHEAVVGVGRSLSAG